MPKANTSTALLLQLGSFYRSRNGYKYICYMETEANGQTTYFCMNVLETSIHKYNFSGYRQPDEDVFGDPEPVNTDFHFVEEVRAEAALYIDPTKGVDAIDYEALWDRVALLSSGIDIQRFSAKTAAKDIADKYMPASIRRSLDRNNIGKLWRARVNKHARWRYEWSIDKAVALAISNMPLEEEEE